jgi:uncharacterized damage-inducible protein DinB
VSEAWLQGPVDGIAPVFQPVAHALVQARDDVGQLAPAMTAEDLWRGPGGGTPPAGFHLLHMVNAMDRLLTYARGELLSAEQWATLSAETGPHPDLDGAALAALVDAAIARALEQVRGTDPDTIFDARRVGRSGLPSTVLGLLFHAAEHTTRHVGQFITTSKIVNKTKT